jgi:hypothetical protein
VDQSIPEARPVTVWAELAVEEVVELPAAARSPAARMEARFELELELETELVVDI